MMKFVFKTPGGRPEVMEEIKINLAALQHFCEGLVTCPYIPQLATEGITLWANDDGLIQQMYPNIGIKVNGYPMVIVGPMVFTSVNAEGDTIGLTADQIEFVNAFCQKGMDELLDTLILSQGRR